jgi:hypothetical protein
VCPHKRQDIETIEAPNAVGEGTAVITALQIMDR